MSSSKKVALVTGGSSGIGEATVLKLQELGYTTYAAARRVQRMEHLAGSGIRPLAMDVTDDESMQSGVKQIVDEEGRIDVLVNNAGYGSYGALEDVPLSEAQYQFEVNVFGAARLTQLVLPHMRERRSGTIINITSMGGKIYTPLATWYHATKFALEALSDCLQQVIAAGVRCIEHGQLADEATAELMAERGVWWSLQPFLDDEDAPHLPGAANRAKFLMMTSGTDRAYRLAKEHGVRLVWGTDTLFDAKLAMRQGAQLAKMLRWFKPAEVLKIATADNASLLDLSGPRNPYPGKLGVVEEGALADLLLVDGDPLQDIRLLEDPARNLSVIMKNGQVVKNELVR